MLREYRVNATVVGNQVTPAITLGPNGEYVIAWVGPDSFTTGIFSRLIGSGDSSSNSSSSLTDNTSGNQTSLPGGVLIGVWAADATGQGWWYRDVSGSGSWDAAAAAAKIGYGWQSAIAVVGDWNGDGKSEVGVWATDATGQGWWYLDVNGNGVWDATDAAAKIAFGWQGSTPVVGDWNGDGKDEVGVWATTAAGQGWWYRDVNGNGTWDATDTAAKFAFGWQGSTPVVGDWSGDGKDEVGVWATTAAGQGWWYRDVNGNGTWDATDAAAKFAFGWQGAKPIVGDWSNSGRGQIGVYATDATGQGWWYRDVNGNGTWDATDAASKIAFGWQGATPVVGRWNGGAALQADSVVADPAAGITSLTQSQLQPIIREAIARWAAAGLDAATIQKLAQVQFVVADLSGSYLGEAEGSRIYLDTDAAGHGWFVDSTPASNEEFTSSHGGQSRAIDPRAVDRIDLLTVVEHELGHIAGFDDIDAVTNDLMSGVLGTGARKNPYLTNVDQVFASA